eukprot:tig00000615_g2607.t1
MDLLDDDLIIPNSGKPTLAQRGLYFANGLVVAAIPVYLYVTVLGMDLATYAPLFAVVVLASAVCASFTYSNTAAKQRAKLSKTREYKQVRELGEGDKKNKKETSKLRQQTFNDMLTKESVSYSILYNNSMFFIFTLALGFWLLKHIIAPVNFGISIAATSGLLLFSSLLDA